MQKLTIEDIQNLTNKKQPTFFNSKWMHIFGQKLKDFQVIKLDNKKIGIVAPSEQFGNKYDCKIARQWTTRIFDNNDLLDCTSSEKTELIKKYQEEK